MKRTLGLLLAAGCAIGANAAVAQLHALTYSERIKPVDSTVYIDGTAHTIARFPITEIGTGTRYAVFYPWGGGPATPIIVTPLGVQAIHNDNPLTASFTIGSFPADLVLSEEMSYTMADNGGGGFSFDVTANVWVWLYIDIGDTILQVGTSFSKPLTTADTGISGNAVPLAQWRKYADDPALIGAIDKWIDFVRIKPL